MKRTIYGYKVITNRCNNCLRIYLIESSLTESFCSKDCETCFTMFPVDKSFDCNEFGHNNFNSSYEVESENEKIKRSLHYKYYFLLYNSSFVHK